MVPVTEWGIPVITPVPAHDPGSEAPYAALLPVLALAGLAGGVAGGVALHGRRRRPVEAARAVR